MKVVAAVIAVMLITACEASNLEVRKGGSFAGSVSGKLPEKANLFAKKSGLSLAESATTNEDCTDAKVGLYAIDGDKEVLVSTVDSAPGGEYFFSKDRLAARKSSPTEKLTIKARFCFGEMRERFVSGSSDQNLDLASTALARWIRQSGKMKTLSQDDIKQLADSIPASEVPEEVQRIFSENDKIRSLLEKKLGSSVETMESASPEIFRLTGPAQVTEGEPAYFTGDVLDWSAARLGFEWKVDGKVLSNSRVLEYLPGMNDQGKHEVTLRVGKKDSKTGALDDKVTTKLSRTFVVDNKFAAEAPPFTAEVSKLSIAKKLLTISAHIHTGENLERCQTFSKIALVKGMEMPAENKFILECKDSKTQAEVFELPWDGGKQIAISMWVRDSSGTVSTKPIVATLTVPIPGLTVQDVNAPTLSAEVVTSSLRPLWNWTSGGGGTGLFRYKLDDSNFSVDATETGAASFTPKTDLSEGIHTLFVQERSHSETWSATASLAITVDKTPPSAPQLSTVQQVANILRPSWTWSSGGAGSGTYRYKLDDSDLSMGSVGTTTATFTPGVDLTEGSHMLYVQEKDGAGNWSPSGSLAIVIDVTAPLPPAVSGIAQTNSLRPTWSWSSGGRAGNGNYRYKLNSTDFSTGATLTTSTSYLPTTDLSEGTHTLSVQERDASGNWSDAGSFVVTIDATAPITPTVSGSSSITNSLRPSWNWVSGGAGNGNFRYKLNDASLTSVSTATTSTSFTPSSDLTEGTFVLYVQEQDIAGNWSNSGSYSVVIDTTAPSAPQFSGSILANTARPTWSWSSGGAGSGTYRYKLDNSDFSSGALTTTSTNYTPGVDLFEGAHTLYVQEKDSAGNWSATSSHAMTVDITAPLAPTVSGNANSSSSRPSWTWTSGGNGGSGNYRYKLDSSDFSTGATVTTSTTYTPGDALSEGTHILNVQERDAAGNWSESGFFQIKTDYTPPSAPAVTGISVSNSQTPTWTWTSGGGGKGSFRYKLNNSGLSSGATAVLGASFTPSSNLSEGTHVLYVQEEDDAGNWSASGSFSIVIDLTAPSSPTLSGPTVAATLRPTWTWSSGGNGSGNYRYRLDNSDLSSSSGVVNTTATSLTPGFDLSEGSHTLYVQEVDASGNWSSSGSHALTVDVTPPTAPLLQSVSPGSPANSNSVRILGVTDTGSTVNLYTNSLCTGTVAATGTASIFVGSGLLALVSDNTTTTFWGKATDSVGNVSDCSAAGITFIEDSTAPSAPTFSGTTPVSASANGSPLLYGSTEAGGTVSIYTNNTCANTAVATGSAATFNSPGIQVTVPNSITRTFYAKVTDVSGNVSTCSAGVAYLNSTNSPPTLASMSSLTGTENELISFSLSGSDPESNTLTYTCSAMCALGLTVDASTGAVLWRPTHGQFGTFTPSFTVSATGGSATISTSITISKDIGTGLDGARSINSTVTINECFPLQSIDGSGNVILGAWSSQPLHRRLLLWQMQDVYTVVSGEQTPRIYSANAPGNAGKWEIVEVSSALQVGAAWQLAIDRVPSFSFISDGAGKKAQACTIPEYTDITVLPAGTIIAQTWDGLAGGVIAFFATGRLTINGNINATGRGLRGGNVFAYDTGATASYDTLTNAYKGESIHGLSYTKQGRGNYGPSGGGGNRPRAGGGGGGHGGIGGYGGYGNYSTLDTTDRGMPGNWIDFSLQTRLMPGAGGGGGQAQGNTTDTGRGGTAGGLIFAFVDDISGTGSMDARGNDGAISVSNGGGGGGSGGSIWIRALRETSLSISFNVIGGGGGNATCTNCGPGGGGGAGRVRLEGGTSLTGSGVTRNGGPAGRNLENSVYGATSGSTGIKE